MAFRRIAVTNFKSFGRIEVDLDRFNVLIGPNASGKSNFVQVFKFLRDISQFGLTNAVSIQGGVEYLRNVKIGPSEDLTVNVVSDEPFGLLTRRVKGEWQGIEVLEADYAFALRFNKKGSGFRVVREQLIQKCKVVRLVSKGRSSTRTGTDTLGEGEITVERNGEGVKVSLGFIGEAGPKLSDLMPPFVLQQKLSRQSLIMENPFLFPPPLKDLFSEIAVYDFDPKLPKKATPITGKVELEEDASNLSLILKNVLSSEEGKRRFLNLVSDLLPFIRDLDVVKFADKSLIFKLREDYSGGKDLPASLISDGTINVTALVAALFFEHKPFAIVEEPERNIHPHLIARVVEMMRDASEKKQILATTHNPELIRHTDVDNLLFVSRDADGFSVISRPSEAKHVQAFLQNDIGIDELFVQGLLGVT